MKIPGIALLLSIVCEVSVADSVHLLGFVDSLCEDAPRCFHFRPHTIYSGEVSGNIKVYYDHQTSRIFDPENYQVTPQQSNIVEGSHLRILMEPVEKGYFAGFIWVGD